MKNRLIILCLLVYGNLYSQNFLAVLPRQDLSFHTIIDSCNIRVFYAFNAIDINKEETYDDLQRLEIGNQVSKYYSFFIFNNDSLVSNWIQKHPKADGYKHSLGYKGKTTTEWNEYQYSEYFKDFSSRLLTQYTRMPWRIQHQQYSENIPIQKWKISEDTLTIVGYLCQKATCQFRGRNFTAWFAMDIPIQNGPWKFGGLPGLILKVYDDDKLYDFECVKIENSNKKYPIKIYSHSNFEKTDRQKFNKLVKKMYDDYYNMAGIISSDKNGNPLFWKKIPYNPLELE